MRAQTATKTPVMIVVIFGTRRRADTLDQLFLAWHVIGQGRKPLHEPIVCVESAGGAEVLLHPRDRLITDGQRLLHDHSKKCAQWPSHNDEKNQECDDRAERSPTSEQPRNPPIKWVAQSSQQCAEQERFQERPGYGKKKRGDRDHQNDNKGGAKSSPANVRWLPLAEYYTNR